MLSHIKKTFDYSPDGIRLVRLNEGETHHIRPELFEGLVASGHIKKASGAKPAPKSPEKPLSLPEAAESRNPPAEAEKPASEPPSPAREADPLDTLEALEAAEDAADERPLVVRHIGRGKYDLFRGDERVTFDSMAKDEAEAKRAALAGA